MPSIAFWPGTPGGTMQYRCKTPADALRRAGWDVTIIEDTEESADVDVFVLQRCLGDWVLPFIKNMRARFPRATLVYDIDDWYDGLPSYNPASREIDPLAITELHDAMRAVDLITVSTSELAEGYKRWNRVVVLPNYLDPEVWTDEERTKYRAPHTHIHIGYTGSMEWRSADLALVKPWLAEFLDDHRECTFSSLGGGPETLAYLGVAGRWSPKVKPEADTFLRPYDHLPAMISDLDVGLVPLVPNRFNQCKSYVKGLELNIMGVPAVASPLREYRNYIRPGVNGSLVRKNEWRHALERVLYDLPRYREGARAVAERYWIDDHLHQWTDAYGSARAATSA